MIWPRGLVCLLTLPAFAQVPESALKFDLADVHTSARSDFTEASGGLMRGGRCVLRHATMLDLVRIAYDVDPNKVLGGPNWLALDRFDVRAKVPAGTNATGVKPMLRGLLEERFALAAHRETRPLQVWALTAGKHPLLKRSEGSGESGCGSKENDDIVSLSCRNMTMAAFASALQRGEGGVWYYLTDNLVVDRTDLPGSWDFDLKYSARWKTAVGGIRIVSLFDALEKLGLKLDASMVPLPVVVVDRVNRTPTPNSADADRAFPPSPTAFEVAAVKPANPDDHGEDGLQLHPAGGLAFVPYR